MTYVRFFVLVVSTSPCCQRAAGWSRAAVSAAAAGVALAGLLGSAPVGRAQETAAPVAAAPSRFRFESWTLRRDRTVTEPPCTFSDDQDLDLGLGHDEKTVQSTGSLSVLRIRRLSFGDIAPRRVPECQERLGSAVLRLEYAVVLAPALTGEGLQLLATCKSCPESPGGGLVPAADFTATVSIDGDRLSMTLEGGESVELVRNGGGAGAEPFVTKPPPPRPSATPKAAPTAAPVLPARFCEALDRVRTEAPSLFKALRGEATGSWWAGTLPIPGLVGCVTDETLVGAVFTYRCHVQVAGEPEARKRQEEFERLVKTCLGTAASVTRGGTDRSTWTIYTTGPRAPKVEVSRSTPSSGGDKWFVTVEVTSPK